MDKQENIEKGIKKLEFYSRLTGTAMFLCLVGILSSPLIWVWVGFGMFMKILVSYVVLLLIAKFLNHIFNGIRDAIKKEKEKIGYDK